METIETYEITDKLLSKNLERIGDLINIDGPMLSLFMDTRNQDLYLFDWVDSDSNYNRWLLYKVDLKSVQNFIDKDISYKKLFLNSIGDFYYTDIRNSKLLTLAIKGIKNLPEIYYPTSDTFFDESDAKNLRQISDLILNLPIIELLNKTNKQGLINNILPIHNHYIGLSEIRAFGEPQLSVDLSDLDRTNKENIFVSQTFQLKKLDQQNDIKSNRIAKRKTLGVHDR